MTVGPENPALYIIFLILVIIFYFVHRLALYDHYRKFNSYQSIEEIKMRKNRFFKITGFYLLCINRGQNVVVKLALVLTNIQILFLPVLFVLLIKRIYQTDYIQESKMILDIIARYFQFIWLLLLINFIFKRRSEKHKY